MKQQPTKKQWDKLGSDKQIKFWATFLKGEEQMCIAGSDELTIPNIGQFIAFLGDDLLSIGHGVKKYTPEKREFWGLDIDKGEPLDSEWLADKELVDVLLKATEEKLK